MATKTRNERRITARKFMGDDRHSWAVFVDGRPIVTGLGKSEVAYYKRIQLDRLNAIDRLTPRAS